MMKQLEVIPYAGGTSTMTYADMGIKIITFTAPDTSAQITLPMPYAGLWYIFHNSGLEGNKVNVTYSSTTVTIDEGCTAMFCANGSTKYNTVHLGGMFTKAVIESLLTGEITTHTHPDTTKIISGEDISVIYNTSTLEFTISLDRTNLVMDDANKIKTVPVYIPVENLPNMNGYALVYNHLSQQFELMDIGASPMMMATFDGSDAFDGDTEFNGFTQASSPMTYSMGSPQPELTLFTANDPVHFNRMNQLLEEIEGRKSNKTGEQEETLLASSWTNEVDCFQYVLAVTGVTTTSNQEIIPGLAITKPQLEALQQANIIDGGQAADTITLKAYGDKPLIDIPIRILLRGD